MEPLAELWGALKQAGAAGGIVFGVLWHLERQERKEAQKQLLDFLPKITEGDFKTAAILEKLTDKLGDGK